MGFPSSISERQEKYNWVLTKQIVLLTPGEIPFLNEIMDEIRKIVC